MRRLILLTLVGMLGTTGLALGQDPTNASIPDIQNGVYPDPTFVTIQDVVVTGVAPYGLWIQEPTGPLEWSGIWCYSSYTPAVEIGDLVTVSGVYVEYYGASEIDISQGGSIVNRGLSPVPDPAVLPIADLTTGSPAAEQWESVLVRVVNVEVTRLLGYGEFSVMAIGGIPGLDDSLRCDDRSLTTPPTPPVGAQFNSITGCHDYTYDDFKMQPRNNDDFDWIAGEPAPALEIAYCISNTEVVLVFDRNVEATTATTPENYFFVNLGDFAASATMTGSDQVLLTTTMPFVPGTIVPEELQVSAIENQSGTAMGTETITFIGGINTITFVQTIGSGLDSSQVAGEVVTVEGVVTGDNTHHYVAPSGNRYYIQEEGGGQWSGIFVYDRGHSVRMGQKLRIAGTCLEYDYKTEIDAPPYVEVLEESVALPPFAVLPAATLSSAASAEPYEGCLVRLENVVVNQDTTFGFGEWTVVASPAGTDTVMIGNDGAYGSYNPQVGEELAFIQGPLDYNYFDIKIEPRWVADIATPGAIGVGGQGTPGARTALLDGYPNPFNPATTIRFSLRATAPVQIAIYDLNGRQVRSLVNGEAFDAGQHELTWDGRSDQGQHMASGIYLYRFHADGVQETRKLALVK